MMKEKTTFIDRKYPRRIVSTVKPAIANGIEKPKIYSGLEIYGLHMSIRAHIGLAAISAYARWPPHMNEDERNKSEISMAMRNSVQPEPEPLASRKLFVL